MTSHQTDDWTMDAALRHWAHARPETPFASFSDGRSLGFGELDRAASQVATGLAGLGVGPGDRVLIMAPNCADFLVAVLATHRRRAVVVPVNVELHGALLAHQVSTSRPAVIIATADLMPRIDALSADVAGHARRVVLDGDGGKRTTAFAVLAATPADESAILRPSASDLALVMYTSGTTGPAKGVLMPHAHCYVFGILVGRALAVTPADRFYVCMPMFHVNALLMSIGCCLIAGATVYVAERFSASSWLSDILDCGATVTNALGVMPEFIMRQPASDTDRAHTLTRMMAVPIAAEWGQRFIDRFGIQLVQVYGMTECNIIAHGCMDDPLEPGCAGLLVHDLFEVCIADPETDAALPTGQIGEILVRPCLASCFMQGYCEMPADTVQAWRNLWFHTGDAGRIDAEGRLHFVDRIRDCIRRRGENISSYDVEQAVISHPAVAECAAVGIRIEGAGGEDEVKVCLVLQAPLEPSALLDWCVEILPRFAVPRFVEVVPALEKTSTGKVRKDDLRRSGITAETWDREAAGYALPRDGR